MTLRKVETEIEIKAPTEKFYYIFKRQAHHVPNISSGSIQGVQDEGNIAKLSIEYEKLIEDVAVSDKYVSLMVNVVKDLDAHFIKA
ncbi:MLP-like protein 31 [Pyrus communis]|uniref:MLP-like protein 31 n=1 Tax=Pyrus communis TaxID=23211 RepID=UPI0035C0D909